MTAAAGTATALLYFREPVVREKPFKHLVFRTGCRGKKKKKRKRMFYKVN